MDDASSAEVRTYLGEMASQLAAMAKEHQFEALAYIFRLAAQEALLSELIEKHGEI